MCVCGGGEVRQRLTRARMSRPLSLSARLPSPSLPCPRRLGRHGPPRGAPPDAGPARPRPDPAARGFGPGIRDTHLACDGASTVPRAHGGPAQAAVTGTGVRAGGKHRRTVTPNRFPLLAPAYPPKKEEKKLHSSVPLPSHADPDAKPVTVSTGLFGVSSGSAHPCARGNTAPPALLQPRRGLPVAVSVSGDPNAQRLPGFSRTSR